MMTLRCLKPGQTALNPSGLYTAEAAEKGFKHHLPPKLLEDKLLLLSRHRLCVRPPD